MRLAPRHLALLKFLLEGYGHLGILSAVDRHKAVAKLSYSPDSEQEVQAFLDEAGQTVPISLVYRPDQISWSHTVSTMR